jgi:glutathionylspermidine synthase
MIRRSMRVRANLAARATELGFAFHAPGGEVYWDESGCYEFTLRQIENDIEAPTGELLSLCMELVDRAAGDEAILRRLRIPEHAWPLIAESWRRRDPSLYGRFDFSYDGRHAAKLLEFNADTPTSLYEAGVFQWFWLQDLKAERRLFPSADQYNSIHEKLIEAWRGIAGVFLHLTCMGDALEDGVTLAYLEDCAKQSGKQTLCLDIGDVGLRGSDRFVDRKGRSIDLLFKLYPWEWMFADAFGSSPAMRRTRFVEPPWKAILSNKGVLPLLWDMAPGHPNLLPAFFEDDPRKAKLGARFVRKPLYSREGANVLIVDEDRVLARREGTYGAEGYIRQALAPLPQFDTGYPVIGSWIVGDQPCGIGIREDDGLVTTDRSRFVPHCIRG